MLKDMSFSIFYTSIALTFFFVSSVILRLLYKIFLSSFLICWTSSHTRKRVLVPSFGAPITSFQERCYLVSSSFFFRNLLNILIVFSSNLLMSSSNFVSKISDLSPESGCEHPLSVHR